MARKNINDPTPTIVPKPGEPFGAAEERVKRELDEAAARDEEQRRQQQGQ